MTSAMCVSRSAHVELTCNSFERADRVQLMRRIRSPAWNGRTPENSLPSPDRLERCRPISPSLGWVDALTSNSAGSGSVVNGCLAVMVDQRNAAHGVAANTCTGSTGRIPHRVERTRISRFAEPLTAPAVTTPPAGTVSIHGASSSAATTRSNSATPENAPCQVVASPSRIVGCATLSTKSGEAPGRVMSDHAVTIASGAAITRRSGRRQMSANAIIAVAPTAARKYATVGCHELAMPVVTVRSTSSRAGPGSEPTTARPPRPFARSPGSSTSPV